LLLVEIDPLVQRPHVDVALGLAAGHAPFAVEIVELLAHVEVGRRAVVEPAALLALFHEVVRFGHGGLVTLVGVERGQVEVVFFLVRHRDLVIAAARWPAHGIDCPRVRIVADRGRRPLGPLPEPGDILLPRWISATALPPTSPPPSSTRSPCPPTSRGAPTTWPRP